MWKAGKGPHLSIVLDMIDVFTRTLIILGSRRASLTSAVLIYNAALVFVQRRPFVELVFRQTQRHCMNTVGTIFHHIEHKVSSILIHRWASQLDESDT